MDVNVQGGKDEDALRYGSGLQAASSRGYDGTVRLLLEQGADVNAQGGEDKGAVQIASRMSREVIVRWLLAWHGRECARRDVPERAAGRIVQWPRRHCPVAAWAGRRRECARRGGQKRAAGCIEGRPQYYYLIAA